MTVTIGRRELLAAIGGAVAAWPFAARGQQVGKLPTIGFLGASTPSAWSQWTAAFVQRLRELGWYRRNVRYVLPPNDIRSRLKNEAKVIQAAKITVE
jgi:hypothetical protein